jgi:hypothetical protein
VNRGGGELLALTAYHVAGQTDGGAWLRSPIDPSVLVQLGDRVFIDGAATISASASQNDLAAFRVVDWKPELALELASALPAVGDTVWVLAVHISDPANPHPLDGPRRHPARVDVSHESALVYTYLGSANSNFTSGAAVLDRDGRVVGVNVGSRVMNPGEVAGLAVHVVSIRRLIGG